MSSGDPTGSAPSTAAGFSGGSIVSQELALRRPDLVRSLVLQSTWPVMDPYLRTWLRFVRWLVEFAPSERVQAGNEGPAAIPGRLPRPRHGRSAAPDHRADAGAGRRARPQRPPGVGPSRRR